MNVESLGENTARIQEALRAELQAKLDEISRLIKSGKCVPPCGITELAQKLTLYNTTLGIELKPATTNKTPVQNLPESGEAEPNWADFCKVVRDAYLNLVSRNIKIPIPFIYAKPAPPEPVLEFARQKKSFIEISRTRSDYIIFIHRPTGRGLIFPAPSPVSPDVVERTFGEIFNRKINIHDSNFQPAVVKREGNGWIHIDE